MAHCYAIGPLLLCLATPPEPLHVTKERETMPQLNPGEHFPPITITPVDREAPRLVGDELGHHGARDAAEVEHVGERVHEHHTLSPSASQSRQHMS